MTGTEPITIDFLADSLFDDLMQVFLRHLTLNNMTRRIAEMRYPQGELEISATTIDMASTKSSVDIYGNDKLKLKMAEASRYFTCDTCGRKIAGGRFAQHVHKCLERKNRG